MYLPTTAIRSPWYSTILTRIANPACSVFQFFEVGCDDKLSVTAPCLVRGAYTAAQPVSQCGVVFVTICYPAGLLAYCSVYYG